MNSSSLSRIRDLIEKAEANLTAARQILASLDGEKVEGGKTLSLNEMASGLSMSSFGDTQILEGIFDGQNMIGPNEKIYTVAVNYASKSKLIPGDRLKLTIQGNGSFLYKQIGPIERKHVKGVLSLENGEYHVLAEGKSYKVLLASVTYFKASIGDELTFIIPAQGDSEWGAIENVIPTH
ncbi:MAG: hypothetical protein WC882_05275 [Candidatus Gracilibacteria bacterium]